MSTEEIGEGCLAVVLIGVLVGMFVYIGTTQTQGDRDAKRIDRLEQRQGISGPDEPQPDVLEELHALQTAVSK